MNRFFTAAVLGSLLMVSPAEAETQWIYVASPGGTPGISACQLDTKTGKFGDLHQVASGFRTGFLALHPTKPILYAATSVPKSEGVEGKTGAVKAFAINKKSGELKELNQALTHDNGTTHIEVDRKAEYVAVCHYGGTGTSLIPLNADGTLKDSVSTIAHKGSSAHPQRQTRPHPHGVAFSHDSRFLCVADLGNDHVEVFAISDDGKLSESSHWKAKPGAGPRHVSFHPNGQFLFCINELDSTLSALKFNSKDGKLTEVETVSTLAKDFKGQNSTAEVVFHPSGKFVYGSNRGHNSTAVFQVDAETGTVTFVEREPTQGDHPRFVGLDSTGKIYLAANMRTDSVFSFHISEKNGALEPTGHQLKVERPMCIVFVK